METLCRKISPLGLAVLTETLRTGERHGDGTETNNHQFVVKSIIQNILLFNNLIYNISTKYYSVQTEFI